MTETVGAKRKHLLLLVGLIAMLVAQPILGHRSLLTGALFDGLFGAISLYLFFIVFTERRERRGALALVLPALASNVGLYGLPARTHVALAVSFHCFAVLFLGLAVAVILHDIFRKSVISGDELLGAVCGYLLGGIAWANLYTLVYLIVPQAFSVNAAVAWRLGEWHLRRALFDYLSFATLTGLGYADITPVAPPAYSLTWLEVVFGQFYMAAVVAQLVGLKLAHAIAREGSGSSDPR
jgi:voltage-gated potassium channel